jgi:hypothetical protein
LFGRTEETIETSGEAVSQADIWTGYLLNTNMTAVAQLTCSLLVS